MKNIMIALACIQTLALCTAARADDDPMALLKTAATAIQGIQSLSADYTTRQEYPPKTGKTNRRVFYTVGNIKFRRPNSSHTRTWFLEHGLEPISGPPQMQFLSTGSTNYIIDGTQYNIRPLAKDGHDAATEMPLTDFFDTSQSVVKNVQDSQTRHKLHFIRLDPPEQWKNTTYKVVEFEYVDDGLMAFMSKDDLKKLPNSLVVTTEKCYIGDDHLIHRIVQHQNLDWSQEYSIDNLQIDPAIETAEFVLPAGCTPQPPPPDLLPKQMSAPGFTVVDPQGKNVSLSDYQGKVVVLDFWATWCGPCQKALPGLQSIAAKYKDRNVVTLAINVWDTKAAFDTWLPDHLQFNALTILRDPTVEHGADIASKLYKVSGIPTQYVIDKQGKIVATFVGYNPDEKDLEKAIKSAL